MHYCNYSLDGKYDIFRDSFTLQDYFTVCTLNLHVWSTCYFSGFNSKLKRNLRKIGLQCL